MRALDTTIERIDVQAFTVPTDGPGGEEADGTLSWDSTTMVLVEAHAGDQVGIGYTYADVSTANFIDSKLSSSVVGADAFAPARAWERMFAAIRNAGRPGSGAMAVAAVDIALWDLKAKLLGVALVSLLPSFHDAVPIYGSGGFVNYSADRLAAQLGGWAADGIPRVKMKISRNPEQDPGRLRTARDAIGPDVELFADSNGALGRKRALYWSARLAEEWDVRWLEEPVTSEDLAGLRMVRDRAPAPLEVAAGEYGYVLRDFSDLLAAGAVDCLQADVTRCGGITGLLQVAGMCAGYRIDLSAHCAPTVSAHAFCAVRRLRHLEYFHDHVRVENLLFDGVPPVRGGALRPDPERPGLGIELKRADAAKYQVFGSS